MGPRLYPLAPSVWGQGEEIPVEHVVQAALFTDFADLRGSAFIDVLLQPNPLTGSWRVRRLSTGGGQGPVLGEIASEHRDRFADVVRVDASLLMPVTVAEVKLEESTGRFELAVVLPPPELAVPRNDAPASALVLPPGDMMVVDTTKGEFTAEELAARSPGQWFVALHRIGDHVAATLGDKVLGGFDSPDNETLGRFLTAAAETDEAGSGVVYARVVLLDGLVALNIAGPDEGIGQVPGLKVPAGYQRPQAHPQQGAGPAAPWSLIEFPDGTWGVTVERDYAADPGDTPQPADTARQVSLASSVDENSADENRAAPADEADRDDVSAAEVTGPIEPVRTPKPETATFAAVPHPASDSTPASAPALLAAEREQQRAPEVAASPDLTGLSEVEKVRLRRQARMQAATDEEGGRHRR